MDPDDAELGATLAAWLTAQAARDPRRLRFGARRHAYRLGPPLAVDVVAAFEADVGTVVPVAYRRFVTEVGHAGAGPFHGLWPLDHPQQRACARGAFDPDAPGVALYRGVIALGHVGCGQLALLVVQGAHAGEVWIDARAADAGVVRAVPDFTSYYRAWIDALTRDELLRGVAPPGACPLPRALSQYLAQYEARAGVAPGALAPAELRVAFTRLPVGAIRCEATGDDPFFAPGTSLDRCPNCALMLGQLEASGLAPDRVVEGENWPLAT